MDIKAYLREIRSWDELVLKQTLLTKKQKGDAFEVLTHFFFKINPLYQFYDDVWLFKDIPQKELDILGLDSQDLGIDLIAKNGKEYHAIQCKYHSDKSSSVTFKEVSTFTTLLEGNPKITQGYICSSANVTSRNLDKVQTKPIQRILADTWQTLDDDFFTQVRSFLKEEQYAPEPYLPKKHQEKAIADAIQYFKRKKHSRGKLIFPCGSGKSLAGYWITQALKSKSILVAVPSLSLVKQTLEVYLREVVANGLKVKWLCICSDEGIGKSEDIAIKTENIGVPCYTDSEYIKNWLQHNKGENIIIFTTYQSGRIIAEITKQLNYSFDIGIFDEAHKTVGSNKKLFSHLLFDENISITNRVFMTATERFFSGSGDDIISMDNYDIYGETFSLMSFKEAIKDELLTDYRVISIEVGKQEVADFIRLNNLVQLNTKWKTETEARSLASMLALRKAMKEYPIKNAVSFHSSIDRATRCKKIQTHITSTYDFEPIDAYTVSGKIPTTKRNDIVQEFARSEKALITNARCLTEGVDVPAIDCIVFADPRRSKVDIVQALGRALRKKEGKEWGYVILPLVYNEETREIDDENFKEIVSLLRSLASNDERIIEYFKAAKDKTNRRSGEVLDIFNIDTNIIDEETITENLRIKIWEKLGRLEWLPFEKAKEFARSLELKSQKEWQEYSKSEHKPVDIPAAPSQTYSDKGWIGYGDWLGTGTIAARDRKYRQFEKAREFAHKLKLKTHKEWKQYTKSENRPNDIPVNPNKTYLNKGWIGYGDWLGTGTIAARDRKYRQFEKARAFVQSLNLRSGTEWREYCKSDNKPVDIPTYPNQTYSNKGWKGMGDWLGTGMIASRDRKYRQFEKAREFAHKLKLKTHKEWKQYTKSENRPDDIPSNPNQTYLNKGWIGYGDWLGTRKTSTREKKYREFEKAREFVQSLDLKNQKEWQEYCKSEHKPDDIPTAASSIYSNKGWIGYGDWLGTGTVAPQNRKYRQFENAREFARSLNLKGQREWHDYCKSEIKPFDIPTNPRRIYLDEGWIGYGDWLGTGTIANKDRKYREFEKARKFAQSLGLKNRKQWLDYCKSENKPADIPAYPDQTYSNKGWKGTGDWLGTGFIANKDRKYKQFEEAREFAQSLDLKNREEWQEYCRSEQKPDDIPSKPERTYLNKGWEGVGDWLGTGSVANQDKKYRQFEKAREFARSLDLKTRNEWREYCKSDNKPDDIPTDPGQTYLNKGWVGLKDWLGTA
jgi:superfamily II DNA or RNA helicase